MSEVQAATIVPTFAPNPSVLVTTSAATVAQSPAPVAPTEPAKVEAVAAPVAPKRLITDAAVEAPKVEAAKPAEAAPVEYKLVIPEGSPLAKSEVEAVTSLAKEYKLTPAQAQQVLTGRHQAQLAEIARTNDAWYAESMADPEIGGDKMQASIANVQKALATYAKPEERKAIANSPFANNALFLRIMNRVAAGMPAEDTIHNSTPANTLQFPSTPDQAAKVMYRRLK